MESDSNENDHGSSERYHDSFSEEAKQINLSQRYDTADNFIGVSSWRNLFVDLQDGITNHYAYL